MQNFTNTSRHCRTHDSTANAEHLRSPSISYSQQVGAKYCNSETHWKTLRDFKLEIVSRYQVDSFRQLERTFYKINGYIFIAYKKRKFQTYFVSKGSGQTTEPIFQERDSASGKGVSNNRLRRAKPFLTFGLWYSVTRLRLVRQIRASDSD